MPTVEEHAPAQRDYPRVAVQIPVQVRIIHAWEQSTRTATLGSLFNVSRGGAGLTMAWVVPPRTRLSILVPMVDAGFHLLAEVVWTSLTPGRDPARALYGVRWVEYLSRHRLEAMLPPPGPSMPEAMPVPRA